MATSTGEYTVRDCAQALMAIAAHRAEPERLRTGLLEAFRPLLKRTDLATLGVFRQANHIANSQYLYYDGQMHLTLDLLPKGKVIPPHDHGTWEAMALWRGRLKHTVYQRTDDNSVPGHAELRIVEDGVLEAGGLALVVPPAEIHSFTALDDETYAITVVGGHYKPDRHYYDPEKKTYVVRNPKATRPAG